MENDHMFLLEFDLWYLSHSSSEEFVAVSFLCHFFCFMLPTSRNTQAIVDFLPVEIPDHFLVEYQKYLEIMAGVRLTTNFQRSPR